MTDEIVSSLVAAWTSGDAGRVAARYADDAVMYHPLVPQPLHGRAAIESFEGGMFAAFSAVDWRATRTLASGRDLVIEFEVRATNSAPMRTPKGEVPATQRRITLRGVSLLRTDSHGRIVEERRYFDSGSLFLQLGLA